MTKIIAGISVGLCLWAGFTAARDQHGALSRDALDRMRDRDLQPDRVMDVIGLRPGMAVGEAGAGYGYLTFKLSARVGSAGTIYANDIASDALRSIERRAASERIGNIKTVLGEETDPRFPQTDLDMVIVFDCLFEFSQPAAWMKNARKYLKPDGRLVIVDPDRSKMSSAHFLSRQQVHDLAGQAGFSILAVDDAFLKSHMIVVLQAVPRPRLGKTISPNDEPWQVVGVMSAGFESPVSAANCVRSWDLTPWRRRGRVAQDRPVTANHERIGRREPECFMIPPEGAGSAAPCFFDLDASRAQLEACRASGRRGRGNS